MWRRTSEFASSERLQMLCWTAFVYVSMLLGAIAAIGQARHALPVRSRAQTLVEWSLAAAVLAFVGIAAWQLAGTAISEAIDRTIANLDLAGT